MEITFNQQLYSQPEKRIDSIAPEKAEDKKSEKKPVGDSFELTTAEKEQIEKLKNRDREVRIHENKHKAVAGQYARGMSFTYQLGPDNRRYAIGGKVDIDTSEIPDNPEKTIEKMKQVKRAALAPAEPSAKDRQIAAMAEREIATQKAEISKEKQEQALEGYREPEEKPGAFINVYG